MPIIAPDGRTWGESLKQDAKELALPTAVLLAIGIALGAITRQPAVGAGFFIVSWVVYVIISIGD
jgi:hypothetical protein